MNKLLLDGPKGKVVLCILEPGNIKKLHEHQPIEFSLNDMFGGQGLPAKLSLAIMYSESPIRDAKQLKDMVKPEGTLIDKRTPVVETTRPHCPECGSTIEQLCVWKSEAPIWLIFCPQCGCTLGTMAPQEK